MPLDVGIEYASAYQKILQTIDNISDMGVDVSKLKDAVNDVDILVKENAKKVFNTRYQTDSYANIYRDGIKMLNAIAIDNNFDEYDFYYKIFNSCKYIEGKIMGSITPDQLKEFVGDMIYNLKKMITSKTINYEYEKSIVNKLHEVAYKLIKLELIMNGDSKLYESIINYDINIPCFNELVLADIQKLHEVHRKVLDDRLCYLKASGGISGNFFDLDIIERIVYMNTDSKTLMMHSRSKLNDMHDRIINNEKVIKDTINAYEADLNVLDSKKNDKKTNKKAIYTNAASLTLSAVVLTTGWLSIGKVFNPIPVKSHYDKRIETYSSYDDSTSYDYSDYISYSEPENTVYIKEYFYTKPDSVVYLEYDVSNQEKKYDTAEEYYQQREEHYGVKATKKETIKSGTNIKPGSTIVEKTDYVFTGKDDPKLTMYFAKYLVYAIYIFLIICLEYMKLKRHDNGPIISSLKHIRKELHELKENNADIRKYEETVDRYAKEISDLIKDNEEIRKKIKELYQQKRYLFYGYEELYDELKKYDELNNKKIEYEDYKKILNK